MEKLKVVSYPNNSGRGKALRAGFEASCGEIIVSIDADLSYNPNYIIDLVETLKREPDIDFVLASPYMPGGGVENVPVLPALGQQIREQNASICHAQPDLYFDRHLSGLSEKVLHSLELESDGKEIHLEILSKAIALGFRVKESPAILTSRKKGKSKFKFKKTAISHLIFSLFEKPMMLFGFLGLLTLAIGLFIGIYIAYFRFFGELTPGRPLITFALLLILGGIQILSFGFIAIQIVSLRREILRIQKENLELRKEMTKTGYLDWH